MSKLTKAKAKAHQQACEILKKDVLTNDEKWFVLENWQESATHINTVAGAFFTPPDLARSFCIEVDGRLIIDLCAGIGTLSFLYMEKCCFGPKPKITCVEINPDYIAVGRKILPEATWVQASVFDLPDLEHFDCAISNPPFGNIKRGGLDAPRFTGRQFEYHVIDIASDLADYGVFIIPQMSAPFRYSGEATYRVAKDAGYLAFEQKTGIELGANCGIDCSCSQDEWHGVAPKVEVVTVDFQEVRLRRAPKDDLRPEAQTTQDTECSEWQGDLFQEAAE
ncbi:methyltransferase [Xanthobacter sp. DSM 24535]|uniref:methyltransferase n=1 Tax=Roseixanthobacter psychrophilus TaxID=3119917 RepID=UPI00372C0D92